MYEAMIIGGGPAGLQAALTLGRMHVSTVVLDSGEYRNATVEHAQNLLTHDGRPPAELRRLARDELEAYDTVSLRDARVDDLARDAGAFVATVGGESVRTRTVILATGVADALPEVPGLAEGWGTTVAHCPFCHGHEFAGREVALLVEGPHAHVLVGMLRRIVSRTIVLAPGDVVRAEPTADGLRLALADGTVLEVAGIFVAPSSTQRSSLPMRLGLDLHPSGLVVVDGMGRTSVDGVFAAGDMAHPAALPGPVSSLAAAIAAGQFAAAAVVQHLLAEEVAE